jgi:propionate CoA-transferase
MAFVPRMAEEVATMDARIFRSEAMGLRQFLVAVPLEERLIYMPERNQFFVNFEGLSVASRETIAQIEAAVDKVLSPLGHKVAAIVNYDNFYIAPELIESYTDAVKRIVERFYTGVTRYTTSTFLRLKLGDALNHRGVSPHIYESPREAEEALRWLASV